MDDSIKDRMRDVKTPKLLPAPEKKPGADATELEESKGGEGYRVLLFNDEVHTMDEVAHQLMKALHCPRLQAEMIMRRAHKNGHAVVTITDKREAEQIAQILREINLRVRVDHV